MLSFFVVKEVFFELNFDSKVTGSAIVLVPFLLLFISTCFLVFIWEKKIVPPLQ